MKTAAFLSGHAYLVSLVTSHLVFADEIDKFHYLATLKGIQRKEDCRIVSFALLDDRMMAVILSKTAKIRPDEMFLTGFRQGFLPYYARRHTDSTDTNADAFCCMVQGTDQILTQINHLHFLPKKLGIVRRIEDYWWDGLQTFNGRYQWDFMDEKALFSLINPDERTARKIFRRYERDQYREEFGSEEEL